MQTEATAATNSPTPKLNQEDTGILNMKSAYRPSLATIVNASLRFGSK